MADLINSLDLNLLKVFRALSQTQSTTRTAEMLNIPQSAVSRALGKLRTSFNDPLFEWRGNTMQPSAVARALRPDIEEALGCAEKALAQVRQFDPQTSETSFTLGLTDYAIYAIFPQLFSRIRQESPFVSINLRNVSARDALQRLSEGHIEFAIVSQSVHQAEFSADRLFDEDYVIVGDRNGIREAPGSVMQLETYLTHKHMLCSYSGDRRGWVDEELEKLGQTRDIQFVFEAFSPMVSNLGGTDLLATIPRRLVSFAEETFGLSHWELPFPSVCHSFHLVMRRQHRLTPARAWFRQTILSIANSDTL